MKIKVNDECGTEVISVLRLDGTPSVEGEDHVVWKGEYHKNGKWSYTEGGVAIRNGVVIFRKKSSHYANNNIVRAYVIMENILQHEGYAPVIIGRWEEVPQKPKDEYSSFGIAWNSILESVLAWGRERFPEKVKDMESRWDSMSRFD